MVPVAAHPNEDDELVQHVRLPHTVGGVHKPDNPYGYLIVQVYMGNLAQDVSSDVVEEVMAKFKSLDRVIMKQGTSHVRAQKQV